MLLTINSSQSKKIETFLQQKTQLKINDLKHEFHLGINVLIVMHII